MAGGYGVLRSDRTVRGIENGWIVFVGRSCLSLRANFDQAPASNLSPRIFIGGWLRAIAKPGSSLFTGFNFPNHQSLVNLQVSFNLAQDGVGRIPQPNISHRPALEVSPDKIPPGPRN